MNLLHKTRMRLRLLACPAICLLCASHALAQGVTLVENGGGKATIVIPDEPLASERFAASELQTYVEKMSGAKLDVVPGSERPEGAVVTVGATRDVSTALLRELDVEECVIRTVTPNRLMIVGGRKPPIRDRKGREWVRDRGTLYGVYELLHILGVRWYDPSTIGEVVPQRPTVRVPTMDYRHKPPFPFRAGYQGLWAVRNRYCGNVWGGPELGGIWYEWLAHMYQYVVPPDRYFREKPEWFPEINGQRTTRGQLCISNPELIDRFTQFALGSYRSNPQLQVIGIEAKDGHGWCECANCRKQDDATLLTPYKTVSMSPRVLDFNVKIAKRVAEQNPNAILGWYIYSDHTEVPRGLRSLPSNLHGRICTYASSYSNYAEPIETGTSPPNRRLREVFEGYRKLLEHISTYEYWSGYHWFGPMPIRRAIAANIRYYHQLGLEGCYQLGPQHWGSQGFNYWLAGRLLWDPTQDEDELLDDYCRNFFGVAGDAVKRYHLRLEQAVADSGRAVMSGGAYIEPVFTEEVIAEARQLLDSAMALADTATIRARINRLQSGVEFARRAARLKEAEDRGEFEEALAAGRSLVEWMNSIHPGKTTRKALVEPPSTEIGAAVEKGDFEDAKAKAGDLEQWLAKIAAGRFVFAAMDSEPGRHLTSQVTKLAESVRDFGRVMSVCDVVCEVPKQWRFRTDPERVGKQAGWHQSGFDDLQWESLPIGVWWENAGHPGYDGLAWYRTVVRIPEKYRGRQVEMFFGAVDGDAEVYVNGELAGSHILGKDGKGWDKAFSVDISQNIRIEADNTVAVSVLDDAAYGGIWKLVKILSPRPDAMTQGRIRFPLERDEHTVLLLDFNEETGGWMANERYGGGALPGQKDRNRAAWFATPDEPKTGIRTGVRLPVDGTIECWVKPTGLQRKHATICTVGTVGNTKINLYVGADSKVRTAIVRKGSSETITSRVALPDSQWTHVAATWGKAQKLRLLINGQLEVEGEELGPPYSCQSDALWLGCQPWWVKNAPNHTAWYLDLNFHGLIDDFRISKVRRETFEAIGQVAEGKE